MPVEIPNAVSNYYGKYMFFLFTDRNPEQYHVYYGSRRAGYVRLRHGRLTVDAEDCGGEELLRHQFSDETMGEFRNDRQREQWMERITGVLDKWRKGKK